MKALVFLAQGFEEIEALAPIDILRRGKIDVIVAGVGSKEITSSHGVRFSLDLAVDDVDREGWDAVICPGGMPGAVNISQNWICNEILIKAANTENTKICAICASPAVVLGPLGLLDGKNATCYPGMEEYAPDFNFSSDGVVVYGNTITAKGAGYAIDFALEILKALKGEKAGEEIRKKIYYERR